MPGPHLDWTYPYIKAHAYLPSFKRRVAGNLKPWVKGSVVDDARERATPYDYDDAAAAADDDDGNTSL